MKLPANYSAISVGEMSYLDGGTWELNMIAKNAVTFVGNTYVSQIMNYTLGVLFSDDYGKKDVILDKDQNGSKYTVTGMMKGYFSGKSTWGADKLPLGPAYTEDDSKFVKAVKWNAKVLGLAAAIYQLGSVEAVPVIGDSPMGLNGELL